MPDWGAVAGAVGRVANVAVGGPLVELADEAISIIRGQPGIPEEDRAKHIERLEELKVRKLEVTEATHVAEVNASRDVAVADAQSGSRVQGWARPFALYAFYIMAFMEVFGLRAYFLHLASGAAHFEFAYNQSTQLQYWIFGTLATIGGVYVTRRTREKLEGKD